MYNFQVEDHHTYYVGNSTILVHNADKYSSNITPDMEKKILEGQRVGNSNRVKRGHSPDINDSKRRNGINMIDKIERLIDDNTSEDYWYDVSVFTCQELINSFSDIEWQQLSEKVNSYSDEKNTYC